MISFETVLFPLFMLLVILSVRRSRSEEILSIEDCDHLRGIFASMIIIFHVSKETDLIYPVFKYCSLIAVNSFFFISGFGLMKGYLNKRDYEKSYLLKRFSRVILPYAIMTFVYWAYYWLVGDHYSFLDVITRIVKFGPLVMYSWFIVSIIMQYLYFFVLMKICRRNMKVLNGIVLAVFIVKLFMSFRYGWDDAAYPDTLFCLGILYACHEKKAAVFIRKWYKALMAVSLVLTGLLFVFVSPVNNSLYETLIGIVFVVFTCSFLYPFGFENKVLRYLGKISFEIYMTQGLAKTLVRRFLGFPLFFQDMVIYVLCLILSVFFYHLFTRLDSYLYRRFIS